MTNREFKVGDRVYVFGDVIEKEFDFGIYSKLKSGFYKIQEGAGVSSGLFWVDGWVFRQDGIFNDPNSKTRSLYHADEVVEVDGVVKVVEPTPKELSDGFQDKSQKIRTTSVYDDEKDQLTIEKVEPVESKPFKFGDKVNAFGVDGVVVSDRDDGIDVKFITGYVAEFCLDGKIHVWHKTPSLFHGWLDCDGETK